MLEAFAITLIGVMAAQAAPGPNFMAVASVALSEGRRAALFVTLGVSLGMLVWSASTALGLAALIEQYPWSLTSLRLIGGTYLLWMAFRAIKSLWAGRGAQITPREDRVSDLAAFRLGLFVLLTNPKAFAMWLAVTTYLFGAGLTPIEVITFGPIGALSGFIIYGIYAVLFSTNTAMRGYKSFGRVFETIFAAAFGALGAKLLFDGLREVR